MNIAGKKFVLFGAILFTPPLIPEDLGHYTAAIKLNQRWEVYDDIRNGTYEISNEETVYFSVLFYLEEEFTLHASRALRSKEKK